MPTLTLADAAIGQQDYGTGLAPTDERDPISAAYVAAGDAFATDYVLAGANFITDFLSATNGIFNVTAGTAILTIDPADVGMTAFAVQTDPGDETSYDIDWHGPVALPISIPQSPDLELEAGVNQVYLTLDPTQNNSVAIEWGTTVDPASPRLLLGSLDTDTESTTLASREPDLEAGALVATSVDADAMTIGGLAVATEAYADQAGFSGSYLDLTDVPTTFAPEDHALAGSAHTASTLTNLNTLVSDATLDDAGDERPPASHALDSHTAVMLTALNAIISDATLDDASAERPPEAHELAAHTASTLSALNAIISDATLDDAASTRPPDEHGDPAHEHPYTAANRSEDITQPWAFDATVSIGDALTPRLLAVVGDVTISQTLDVTGNVDVGGDGYVDGQLDVNDAFVATANAYWDDAWDPSLYTRGVSSRLVSMLVHMASTGADRYPLVLSSDNGVVFTVNTAGNVDAGGNVDASGTVTSTTDETFRGRHFGGPHSGSSTYFQDGGGTDRLRLRSSTSELYSDLDVSDTVTAGYVENTINHSTVEVSHTRYVGPDDPATIGDFNVQEGDRWVQLQAPE